MKPSAKNVVFAEGFSHLMRIVKTSWVHDLKTYILQKLKFLLDGRKTYVYNPTCASIVGERLLYLSDLDEHGPLAQLVRATGS